MLGWFKKKLSGKKEEAAVEETAAPVDVQADIQIAAQVDATEELASSASSSPVTAEKGSDKVTPASPTPPVALAAESAPMAKVAEQELSKRLSLIRAMLMDRGKSRRNRSAPPCSSACRSGWEKVATISFIAWTISFAVEKRLIRTCLTSWKKS
ncbi:hypothetical protein GMJAKD_01260 [Candidatus Electrothrix aarhusensis]